MAERFNDLLRTPHDDWSRTRRPIRFEDGTETYNVDDPVAQLARMFEERYLDLELRASHLGRFQRIAAFVTEHTAELVRDGYATLHGSKIALASELVDALVTGPYSRQTGGPRESVWVFDYRDVVHRMKKPGG